MDNNNYASIYHQNEAILAADALDVLSCQAGNAFSSLLQYHQRHKDWLFGHLAYDLKNETFPGLSSQHQDGIGFPDLFFFRPRIIMLLNGHEVRIGGWEMDENDAGDIYTACTTMPLHTRQPTSRGLVQSRLDQQQYLDAVKGLQEHIHRGDCYEINFCRENYIEDITVDPLTLFEKLNQVSPSPFAAYYRTNDLYMACSSPERFMQKHGPVVISQPIKGTIRRADTPAADEARKKELQQNSKERAENVMVVDLVRNDLSQTAQRGSVEVSELFGIYSFAQVHHMISTVKAIPAPGVPFTAVISQAFPMGSMTGAPKLSVLQLIEQYERSRRGLFSGALGYITPEGDFDFNVVIRSILYNAGRQYLSFTTGSAITYYADPVKEWEECLLKAEAMRKILEG
ncbi:anthranilate synthase component I family protein [Chitinophaga rhizophila]|uniref:anthranilate synthase component I family protein n=1 Tax=Chitinophaga rhizophila TaxID=2866212 RepID=UPI001F434E1D|nr:anthranilate synthase component I family protein [Chitinophaga rhizophila]